MTSIRVMFTTLLLIGSLWPIAPVHAHSVNMFAYVEGKSVVVEGFFTDGKVTEKAEIRVFSPDGEVLVEGQADDEGIFVFDIPAVTDLRISLYAGMGHRVEYTLPADELRGAVAPAGVSPAASDAGPAGMAVALNDAAALETVIRQVVTEAQLPLVRNVAELRERRTISDIIGGIGFIVGIVGVFFYLKARGMKGRSAASGN
jgi:nickel transport protein